ncbi:hypothetical protein Aperf_G00000113139 [Anoplocephala perfoliata]
MWNQNRKSKRNSSKMKKSKEMSSDTNLSDSNQGPDESLTTPKKPKGRPKKSTASKQLSVNSNKQQKTSSDARENPDRFLCLRPRRRERRSGGNQIFTRSRNGRHEDDETPDEETPDGRRYPLRNRRQSEVFQAFPRERMKIFIPKRRRQDFFIGHNGSPSSSLSDRDNEEVVRESLDRYSPSSPHKRPSRSHRNEAPDELEESYLRQAAEILRPISFKPTDEPALLRNRFIPNAGVTSVEPMECFDTSVTFNDVAGLQPQIQTLRESVVLPLVYPELFQNKTIEPPRGVLFHGPPGTGKTLLARALANECMRMSSGEGLASNISGVSPANARQISFFIRKGADCLSKWVGETERLLRDLFDEAYRLRPSIIFFDELDGLAPVRSSRQDQVHSSIVATILSLMDGLDRRPGVVVIGATNRPDAIDPALRRPGRFDREFTFRLPNRDARRRILEIHTAKWDPKPSDQLLDYLASETTGYCGADIKALTTEACLCCLRRQYPQVYESKVKLDLDLKYLVVDKVDWCRALRTIRPASLRIELDVGNASTAAEAALASTHRSVGGRTSSLSISPSSPQNMLLEPLIESIASRIARALSASQKYSADPRGSNDGYESMVVCNSGYRNFSTDNRGQVMSNAPALIQRIVVEDALLPPFVFPAVWQRLESVEVYTLNLASLYSGSAVSIMTSITQITAAARRSLLNQQTLTPSSKPGLTSSPTNTSSPNFSNLQGVVIFVPRIDLLLGRLSIIHAQHLVERLNEVSSATATTAVYPSRRLVLVATVKSLSPAGIAFPPAEEQTTPSHRTGALSVRVPIPAIPQRINLMHFHNSTPQESHIVLNGHASPKTVSWLRDQQSGTVSSRNRTLESSDLDPSEPLIDGEISSTFDVEAQTSTPNPGQRISSLVAPAEFGAPAVGVICTSGGAIGGGSASGATIDNLLRQIFRFPFVEKISFIPPGDALRRAFLRSALLDWLEGKSHESADFDLEAAARRLPRPPTPKPVQNVAGQQGMTARVSSVLDGRRLTREEAVAVEKRDRLLRRFRMAMRNFLANLRRDRRFSVFMRSTAREDAPSCVSRRSINISQIRRNVDSDKYTSIVEFKRDLKLICENALECDPSDERAYEFQDIVDESFDEDVELSDLSEMLADALTACPLNTPSPHPASEPVENNSPKNSPQPPPGRRYSRRLHGESPVFVGGVAVKRRRTLKNTEEDFPDDAPTPLAELDQQLYPEDSETQPFGGPADLDTSAKDNGVDPNLDESDHEDDDERTEPCASPNEGESSLLAHSESTATPWLLEGPLRALHLPAMESFLKEAVEKTRGWSVSQLMALHCDLSAITQRISLSAPLDPQELKSNLLAILQSHKQMAAYEGYEESPEVPSLKHFSPTGYL